MSIDWKPLPDHERKLIGMIADRAITVFDGADKLGTVMDITAVHQVIALDLEGLLNADRGNFVHDVAGIARHLDRETGELTGCFRPRFAA